MQQYIEGDRYKRILSYIKHYGNSNARYVEFKDEDGNVLHWLTNDYTKAYQNLKNSGEISFTIESIYKGTINIRNLKIK
jgi:hypothetical protein